MTSVLQPDAAIELPRTVSSIYHTPQSISDILWDHNPTLADDIDCCIDFGFEAAMCSQAGHLNQYSESIALVLFVLVI